MKSLEKTNSTNQTILTHQNFAIRITRKLASINDLCSLTKIKLLILHNNKETNADPMEKPRTKT